MRTAWLEGPIDYWVVMIDGKPAASPVSSPVSAYLYSTERDAENALERLEAKHRDRSWVSRVMILEVIREEKETHAPLV